MDRNEKNVFILSGEETLHEQGKGKKYFMILQEKKSQVEN